jgi:UDP-N-acetylglucosamine acyltransferase
LVPINIPEAIDRLCYRYPSALVDAIVAHEPGRRIVAVKNVTVSEDFFQGHFPGTPLMPGVLMIETLAQVATLLLVDRGDGRPAGNAYLRGVDHAKFRRQVVPGDRLQLEVSIAARRAKLARAHAVASIGDMVVAEAQLLMGLVPDRVSNLHPGVDVHPSAIVAPGASIGEGTVVGPFVTIGEHVRIGRSCRIGASAVIDGWTDIGDDNEIFPMASIGLIPQDLKFGGEKTKLTIGNRNVIREFVTIHRGTAGGGGITRIGDHNLFMAYAHVAHDCQVGNETIFANGATLAGHVLVEDYATVGAFSGVHQYCRVGRHAFIGGYSVVTKDALPFTKTVGNRARVYGINTIGLTRRRFTPEAITKLRRAFRYLLHSNTSRALAQIERDASLKCDEVRYVVDFIRSSTRGVGLRRPSRRLEEVLEE